MTLGRSRPRLPISSSTVHPSITGIMRSRSMMSGGSVWSISRAASPFVATYVRYPSISRLNRITHTRSASSSTTRTFPTQGRSRSGTESGEEGSEIPITLVYRRPAGRPEARASTPSGRADPGDASPSRRGHPPHDVGADACLASPGRDVTHRSLRARQDHPDAHVEDVEHLFLRDLADADPVRAEDAVLLHHSDAEPGQVEPIGLHHAGMLRGLAAQKGAAGPAAPLGHPLHQSGDLLGHHPPHRQVVEE